MCSADLIIPKVGHCRALGDQCSGAISFQQFISIFLFDLKWCFCCIFFAELCKISQKDDIPHLKMIFPAIQLYKNIDLVRK